MKLVTVASASYRAFDDLYPIQECYPTPPRKGAWWKVWIPHSTYCPIMKFHNFRIKVRTKLCTQIGMRVWKKGDIEASMKIHIKVSMNMESTVKFGKFPSKLAMKFALNFTAEVALEECVNLETATDTEISRTDITTFQETIAKPSITHLKDNISRRFASFTVSSPCNVSADLSIP